jgi:large conductance mechanosensitive channel
LTIKEGTAAPGPYATIDAAQKAGAVTINYGMFINTVISFLIVAYAIFIVIKALNKLKKKEPVSTEAPTTKDCPYCFEKVSINAKKCPHCTSQLT